MGIVELAANFTNLRNKKDELSATLKAFTANLDEAEKQLLEAMAESGVNSIKLEGLGLFSMRTKNYFNVNAEDKPKFFEYLKNTSNESILKLDINPQTLKAFLSDHFEELVKTQIDFTQEDLVTARQSVQTYLENYGVKCFTDRVVSFKKE